MNGAETIGIRIGCFGTILPSLESATLPLSALGGSWLLRSRSRSRSSEIAVA